jgi:hypothetical protein
MWIIGFIMMLSIDMWYVNLSMYVFVLWKSNNKMCNRLDLHWLPLQKKVGQSVWELMLWHKAKYNM